MAQIFPASVFLTSRGRIAKTQDKKQSSLEFEISITIAKGHGFAIDYQNDDGVFLSKVVGSGWMDKVLKAK